MRTIERQLRARQTAVSLNEKELSRLMKPRLTHRVWNRCVTFSSFRALQACITRT